MFNLQLWANLRIARCLVIDRILEEFLLKFLGSYLILREVSYYYMLLLNLGLGLYIYMNKIHRSTHTFNL